MLGLGLLLHDVGKLALPGKLIQKPEAADRPRSGS